MSKSTNKCTRCGKDRIIEDTWKEETKTTQGTSELTYTQYICPDAECQEEVEKELAKKRKIAQDREAAHQKRLKERQQASSKK